MDWVCRTKSEASAKVLETIYDREDAGTTLSSDPPLEDWSSLILEVNPKMALSMIGEYDPGSGEVCAKYIPLSDSDVLKHPYYKYPAVTDPGIIGALNDPDRPKIYGSDGQELYLDLCEEVELAPVKDFYRGLLKNVINLKYYCVNPDGVGIMCMALAGNRIVQRLDLTSSFLNMDACIHLGKLLADATSLKELILAQCRIGPLGLMKLVANLFDRKLDLLDLSKNQLGNDGIKILAELIMTGGAKIKKLNLSHNGLTVKSAVEFSRAMHCNVNTITHLDLSWNELNHQRAVKSLMESLSKSVALIDIDLSWNGIAGGPEIASLLQIKTLERLNLSNNKLTSTAISALTSKLVDAKTLQVLDLSGNPLGPTEAYKLLRKMRLRGVKLNNLLMDDIVVSKEFAQELKYVLSLKHRKQTTITHGRVMGNYTLAEADMRNIILRRLVYIGRRGPKKGRIDMLGYFLSKRKRSTVLIPKQMQIDMKKNGVVQVGEDVINELTKAFPGPKIDRKNRAIDLENVADFIIRMWPDAKPLVTPPASDILPAVKTPAKPGKGGKHAKPKPEAVKKKKGKKKK